jgi:hypothetical protein
MTTDRSWTPGDLDELAVQKWRHRFASISPATAVRS